MSTDSGAIHCSAIVSPEGVHLAPPLKEGEGLVIADLDFALIDKRKRMMDSVGHYARPELLSLAINTRPAHPVVDLAGGPLRAPTAGPVPGLAERTPASPFAPAAPAVEAGAAATPARP